MLKLPYLLLCSLLLLLAGCGGSSSKKDSAAPFCDDSSNSQTSTICGTINSAANMQFDTDLNDSNTPLIDNSTFSSAQKLENFVTLQGFLTKTPTRTFNSSNNDRYFNSTDTDDVFKVQLQAGQRIQLQVVNFEPIAGEVFSGDIDLYLYSQNHDLLGDSETLGEFEYLDVQNNGTYFIVATAYTGASKYILQILPAPSDSTILADESSNNAMNFVPNQLIVQYDGSNTFQAANSDLKTLHQGVSRPTLAFMDQPASFNISSTSSSIESELASLNHLSYQKLLTLKKLKALKQQSNVVDASLNYIRDKQKTPSDNLYRYQWHYEAMNLPQAWDLTTGSPENGSIIVAVVDTGIYSAHPDLANQLVDGYDFISDDSNSGDDQSGIDNNPEDPGDGQFTGSSSWHGTHVAGTVAAQSDNNTGVAGVSWGAKIMPIRVLGKEGGYSYDIMEAMRFAAGLENDSGTLPNQAADIINLSLGGYGSSSFEANLYKQIHDMGIIIVAAAGNDNRSTPSYPASYPGVISVSATDYNKNKAPYSNFGDHIDIAAPGGNSSVNLNGDDQPDGVLSTLVDDTSGTKKAVYSFYDGTSMAAPHVSGMFALMKAVNPNLDASLVDSLLVSGSLTDDIGATGRDNYYGYGSANALKAVQTALALNNGGSLPASPPILLATPSSLSFSETTNATLTISNEGDGEPQVLSAYSNNYWLSVSALETDEKGLGKYQISVSGENLSDGFYLGSVIFTFDNSPSLSVRVSLNVGDIGTSGNLATLYTLLYDVDRDVAIEEVQSVSNSADLIQFKFSDIPEGRYEIISGTDVDNDGFICQLGEACAIYPSSSQIDLITIRNDETETVNIDMTAIILNTLNNISTQKNQPRLQDPIKRPSTSETETNSEKKVASKL